MTASQPPPTEPPASAPELAPQPAPEPQSPLLPVGPQPLVKPHPGHKQRPRTWTDRLLRRPQDTEPRLAVALDHVSRRFGDVVGVDDISLSVPEGAIVGVIGPSGAGKTTSIRLMTGSLAPDSGTVTVLGENPRRFHRRTRERIGYMPQLFVLYPDLTTRENVDFMASLFGIPPWRRGSRVAEVLEFVDLTEARNRRASALSGGMQRRLELACALVHQPTLLVLDEPTAGIDPLLRTRVWQELDRLRQTGVTVIVTTQYVSEAEYCDAVALISEGELVAFASPSDMRRQALGGEVIEIATRGAFDVRSLPRLEGVVSVRQLGPRQLLVVAVNAGLATPQVNDAIERAGGTVEFSREYRPTFDEVFAALVTAHLERGKEGGADGASQPGQIPQAVARPR
jgi:ABC-2 type transport system ATP-binding protein